MESRIKNYLTFFLTNNTFRNFLYFFLISVSLWFLSRLSDKYTYQLKIPVLYYDQDYKAYPPTFSQDSLKVEIEATGFQLLKLKIKKPVFNYQITEKSRKNWNPGEKEYNLRKLLGKNIKIIKIKPETINLWHKNSTQKRVPVKVHVSLDYKPGFKNTSKPEISPTTILIVGKKEFLDTVSHINTKNYQFNQIDNTLEEKLYLDLPPEIKSNTSYISFKLPVDQIIEEEKKINVSIDESMRNNIMILPKKVQIKYSFFKKDYEKIKKFPIEIILDKKAVYQKDSKVPLKLKKKPKEILQYQIIPEEVTLLIKDNNHD